MKQDPYALVWTSLEPFEARVERVAVYLEALAQHLQSNPSDKPDQAQAERTFLANWQVVCQCTEENFTRIVSSAHAQAIVNRIGGAQEAFGAVMASDAEAATSRFQFGKSLTDTGFLALAAAIHEDKGVSLIIPLECELPCHLPGTDLLVMGQGRAALAGYERGCLLVKEGGQIKRCAVAGAVEGGTVDFDYSPMVARSPGVHFGDRKVLLSPWFFGSSSLHARNRSYTLSLGLEGHRSAIASIDEAVDAMRRYAPDSFSQMAEVLEAVGLEDVLESENSQASLSDLPGTFIVPVYPRVHANMEMWIHEFYHNRLFALEGMGAVFNDEKLEQGGGELLFSPWRVEPRPLKGLLHSAYVFVPVAQFALARYLDVNLCQTERDYALDDTIRHVLQLQIASYLLNRQRYQFSTWGELILDQLDCAIDRLVKDCDAANIPDDADAMVATENGTGPVKPLVWSDSPEVVSVRQNLRANIARGDLKGDCASLPLAI